MIPSELLAKPEHWTKGSYARDANGLPTEIFGPSAVSFCLIGALKKCCVLDGETILDSLIKARGFRSVADFNDRPNTTHDHVLSILKEAGL